MEGEGKLGLAEGKGPEAGAFRGLRGGGPGEGMVAVERGARPVAANELDCQVKGLPSERIAKLKET